MDNAEILPHLDYLRQAIHLAHEASRLGNLPIGALIVLDNQVIARGQNAIWKPDLALTCHAEMEALRAVKPVILEQAGEMTLYTTLEPCVMCAGAILLHGIRHVFYGSTDPYGGVGAAQASLPPFFSHRFANTHWEGPLLPEECDPLYLRVQELEGFYSP